MTVERGRLGRAGETEAERFLRAKGYTIVARNYRSGAGEIDLVALSRQTVVFVEVRSLSGPQFGDPLATVTPRKQRHIARAALSYLSRHRLHDRAARFDVIGIRWQNDRGAKRPARITHIQDAFELPSGY